MNPKENLGYSTYCQEKSCELKRPLVSEKQDKNSKDLKRVERDAVFWQEAFQMSPKELVTRCQNLPKVTGKSGILVLKSSYVESEGHEHLLVMVINAP